MTTNDAVSVKANIEALYDHISPRVCVDISDLAYTLPERQTRLWHRAFVTTNTTVLGINDFVVAEKSSQRPEYLWSLRVKVRSKTCFSTH